MEINEKFLSPCGLYCGVCGVYYATRDNNPKFLEKLLNFYQNAIFPASLSRTFRYRWERKSFCDPSRIVKNGEPKSGLKMRSPGTSVRIVAKPFSGVRSVAKSVRLK
jgi:hypothetical protein